MTPVDTATVVLLAGPALGLGGAGAFGVARRGRATGLRPRTALARAGSYAALALVLLIAIRLGIYGVAVLLGIIAALGLFEWGRLFDLPLRHLVALEAANVLVFAAITVAGEGAAAWLVALLVLVGAALPVVRADTGRGIRDFGIGAVGVALISVLLAHGVGLAIVFGETGLALVAALAVACAFSDVGAFVVGRTFGRHPLAPSLSPSKTREGVIGNFLGAAIGIALFLPAIVPTLGWPYCLALVPLVAGGSLWGDLLESAAKREAGVKDAGAWLPGFGGILDRVDSLLITVALAYWIARLWGMVR
ncbi:MAG TPA: phosphatidate cytidylyltransferase [Solirubrobacterales bacterium]